MSDSANKNWSMADISGKNVTRRVAVAGGKIRIGSKAYGLLVAGNLPKGDPLAMVMYGVGLLPLIRILKTAVSDVHQPWYADDAGAGGHFNLITRYFEKLQEFGTPRGYFPESSKSILIVQEHN